MTNDQTPRAVPAPEGWTPAFPGQRPPFQKGHTLAQTHGAGRGGSTPRTVSAVATEIETSWRAEPTWPSYLNDPVWQPMVTVATHAAARYRLLAEYVDGRGVEEWLTDRTEEDEQTEQNGPTSTRRRTSGKRVRSAMDALERAESSLVKALQNLGLTPSASAKLGRNVVLTAEAMRGSSLDAIRDAGRSSVAGRAGQALELDAGDDDHGPGAA